MVAPDRSPNSLSMMDCTAQQSASPPVSGDGGGGESLVVRPTAGGVRKKGALVRAWLVVGSTGHAEVVEAEKHVIMQRTGIPVRDLRILDPALTYPSTILGRERAIVVNLENIKTIITSKEMIFQSSKDPFLTAFVQKIQGIFRHRQAVMSTQESGGDGNSRGVEERASSMVDGRDHMIYTGSRCRNEEGNADVGDNAAHRLKLLPFEFVALETCLAATCSSLDNQARRLEQEANPALDKLTSKISALNLDRVSNIKSRLITITARVQKVRDELEHLFDDDEDMAEMYLTEKISSMNELEGVVAHQPDEEEEEDEEEDNRSDLEILMGRRHDSNHMTCRQRNRKNLNNVKELEMILEAYFVQTEGTLNRLSTVREYVDDTKDFIKMMQNEKQNQVLQMDVKLKIGNVVVSAFVALGGVFGMNIHEIDLFKTSKSGDNEFLWTIGGGTIACAFCYLLLMAWCRYQRLFE